MMTELLFSGAYPFKLKRDSILSLITELLKFILLLFDIFHNFLRIHFSSNTLKHFASNFIIL